MRSSGAEWTTAGDAEELCGFFRRRSSHYELLQAGSGAAGAWGAVWTFPARNRHAAEKAGWMMRRLVDPSTVAVRHACRVRLRARTGPVGNAAPRTEDVVVVTVLPDRVQIVLLVANGAHVTGLPFLRCGGAQVVAVAMGLLTAEKGSGDGV